MNSWRTLCFFAGIFRVGGAAVFRPNTEHPELFQWSSGSTLGTEYTSHGSMNRREAFIAELGNLSLEYGVAFPSGLQLWSSDLHWLVLNLEVVSRRLQKERESRPVEPCT